MRKDRNERSALVSALAFSVALTGGLMVTAAQAGDCEPAWDPDFGVPGAPGGNVFDFVTHDDGTGPALFASGTFTSIGGVSASRIAKWDGKAWSAVGAGADNNEVYAVGSFDGDLYIAGYFNSVAGVPGTAKIARWDGKNWQSLNAQLELFSNQLWDLKTWDDGTGEALYVAGNYQNAGGVTNASFISKWDGETFVPLGTPIGGAVPLIVFTAYVWDDGTGEALYVGGRFLSIDGVPASRIAKWDGENWSALGAGVTGAGVAPSIMDMVAFDDGTGEALYVAGQAFTSAGGQPANRVAKWDGEEWSAVGAGFDDGIIWDVEVFDDGSGSGPMLYAFGTFTASGGQPVNRAARWNGKAWEQVGNGASDSAYGSIVHDDGSGPALYVGGSFTSIADISANRIARYDSCPVEGVPGDLNNDGVVNVLDLLALLGAWGDCVGCDADLNGDDVVDVLDLLALLSNWG